MNRYLAAALAAVASLAVQAQPAAPTPSAEIKQGYNGIKNNLTKAAEKMPEELYSFQATPDVRTFGALIAHIADSQTRTCNAILGEPKSGTAGSKTAKADLVAALKESFADCDKAYDSLTDANATQVLKFGQREATRLGALVRNVIHDNEEYGYLAVYMRLKDIVPPSSEGR
jgi:hypothetical protein